MAPAVDFNLLVNAVQAMRFSGEESAHAVPVREFEKEQFPALFRTDAAALSAACRS